MTGIKTLRFRVSHITFSLLFTISLFIISNALNLDRIAKWFPQGANTDFVGLTAFLIFGLCFFMAFFILFAHPWVIKPVAVIFIFLSGAATYFISKYQIAIDRSMVVNSINTDITEVTGLLSIHMLPYVFFLIVLPVLIVLRADITFQKVGRYLAASLALLVFTIAIGAGALYLNYKSIHRAANVSHKYILHTLVPANLIGSIVGVLHRSIGEYYDKNKQAIEITGRVSSQDDLVVVLAIGETSRQKNFSIYGYDRKNTNPVLSKETGLHILNGKAEIGTTILALLQILEKNDIKLTAITSKLGIDTACYVNYSLYGNCKAVGEIEVSNCGHGGKCYDEDVIPLLQKNLETYVSGYKFIILHLGGGSHGPSYTDRYPPEFQIFNPQCKDADVVNQCTLEELYNSYDNTILYVDHVLGKIINKLDDSELPYTFIYLSDHGESLLENDRIFHGMPPGIPLPPEQAEIPLIVKSSVPISIVPQKEYRQQDVYDTVLDLLSIESELVDKERSFIKKNIQQ